MSNHLHVNGFHHVAIKVRDFDASLKLYTETLGFTASHLWGEGENRGALIDTGKGNYIEIFAGGPKEDAPEGYWFHIALACSDTVAAMKKVREAGLEVTMEVRDIVIQSDPPLPIRIAFFKGLDGESIELFQVK